MSHQAYLPEPAPPPPGWYPDPGAVNTMRYWDGRAWTAQSAPMMPPQPPVVIAAPAGVNHLIHLILTLVTCGMWAPVWLLIAMLDSRPDNAPPWPTWTKVVGGVLLVLLIAASAWSQAHGTVTGTR